MQNKWIESDSQEGEDEEFVRVESVIKDNPGFTEEQEKINKIKDEIKNQYKNIFFDNQPYFKELTSKPAFFITNFQATKSITTRFSTSQGGTPLGTA